MFQKVKKDQKLHYFQETNQFQKTIFKLDNVGVKFGNIQALKDVNLRVNQGEIVFITGASGAGKTTLLNILAGNYPQTSGTVTLPTEKFSAQVFQELRLVENMTCLENLKLVFDPSIYKNKKEFENDLYELAKILGITKRLNIKVSNANGGLRQKVAIIRALLTRPDIFIADEPTSSLDYDNAKRLFDLLNVYNTKRGMTVIWASHNRELVGKFVGKILHLESGRLIHSGHACFI